MESLKLILQSFVITVGPFFPFATYQNTNQVSAEIQADSSHAYSSAPRYFNLSKTACSATHGTRKSVCNDSVLFHRAHLKHMEYRN